MMEMPLWVFVGLLIITLILLWSMYRIGYMYGKHCSRMSTLDVIHGLKDSGIGIVGQIYILGKMEEAWNKEDGRK